MEGQSACVDAEQCVIAQNLNVPVLEVEGIMENYGSRIDGIFGIGSICNRSVDERLVVRSIYDREVGQSVGQSGNADGRRSSDGSNGGCRNCVRLRVGDRFGWRLKDLGFWISAGGIWDRDRGSCGGAFLVRASRFGLPGRERRWGRKALPAALP